jgi:unsaturated rhamnogalacturonyl hydrolase
MIRRLSLTLAILLSLCVGAGAAESKDQALALMGKAFDWQMAALPTEQSGKNDNNDNWVRATFFDGVMALYGVSEDDRYLDAMLKIAEENKWKPGDRFRHADAQAVGQLYAELYLIKKDARMIAPIRQRWDQIMAQPMPGRKDWWWCDALFMAPPVLARLSAATGDLKYLDFMDKQYSDTTAYLYDKSEHLFFRDDTFFKKKEPNGQKIFWSRGNGWVLAGLARILQFMPADYPARPKYVQLFTEMADRISTLQQPDGFWRVGLLDPSSISGGETSGTGMYCFAMAWGINNGLLPADKYRPVVDRAWKALQGTVEDSGKVDWVQPVGSAPAAVTKENTAEFGVGALLMAGSEVVKLSN